MSNEYEVLKLVLNFIIVIFSTCAICFLEYLALKNNVDGILLATSLMIIALVSGVKGKEIKEIITTIYKKKGG